MAKGFVSRAKVSNVDVPDVATQEQITKEGQSDTEL